METGILTFQRAENCGAALQCYALQEKLRMLGADVQIIDYQQPYIRKAYAYHPKLRPVRNLFRINLDQFKRNRLFRGFRDEYMTLSPKVDASEIPVCDSYFIGSDQVWSERCTETTDPVYFGFFRHPETSPVFGYSVSCPLSSLTLLGSDYLKASLANFAALSFREEEVARKFGELTGTVCPVTLDPTLLHDSVFWEKLTLPMPDQGVLLYLFDYRMAPVDAEKVRNEARRLAATFDTHLTEIPSDRVIGPREFISRILNARYVVTNSFHAVAFSLLFHRPLFAVTAGDGLDGRYRELLSKTGAADSVGPADTFRGFPGPDYQIVDSRLASLRKESTQYLINCLSLSKRFDK